MPGTEPVGDEFALISRFFYGLDSGPGVGLGNGDDAAVLDLADDERLAVSVDTMVEGVHFPTGSRADQLIYRAVAAAVSDLAAMGARPLAMTLALTLPEPDEIWLTACRGGLEDAVTDFAMPLVGGDLTRGPLTVSVQVMGADGGLRRHGAQIGDRVYVGGCLGDAAAGLAVIQGELSAPADLAESLTQRFWKPTPNLTLGQALAGKATAAIDVSDGLLADVGHLASGSGVCVSIDSKKVPVSNALRRSVSGERALLWALAGGEDYVLCFTLPQALPAPAGAVEVGFVKAGAGVECDMLPPSKGFRHFS